MISVIVPLFNEGVRVAELVAHLKRSSGFAEYILVDASDAPDSLAIFQKFAKSASDDFIFIKSEQSGRAAQMNRGASQAVGDMLLFLHCDTRLPENAAQLIRRVIQGGSKWGRFDVRLDAAGWAYRLIESMINLRSRTRSIATGDQAIFVESGLFNAVGGFPDTALMEDIKISRNLAQHHSPGLVRSAVVTSARRWKNRGVIKTVLLMWRLRFLNWIGTDSAELAKLYGHER